MPLIAAFGSYRALAASTQLQAVSSLESALLTIQGQWKANSAAYEKQQAVLHDTAESLRGDLCNLGRAVHCGWYRAAAAKPFDIDKLAYAIAIKETQNCKTGTGRAHKNNCHGITDGNGDFATYGSPAESYVAFKEMWLRKYGDHFPTEKEAILYSSNPDVFDWLKVVASVYNR